MFSMITYIVLFKDGFFSVFLSGCLADTELSFLPERYSRCFRVDDMIQKEPFTAQYASYIDKCDQSEECEKVDFSSVQLCNVTIIFSQKIAYSLNF